MKRTFLNLRSQLLCCAAISMLPALVNQAAAKPPVIGFVQVGAESGWRVAETDSVKSEAEKRGVTLKFSDAQNKHENEIKAMRGYIAQNVDVIILDPDVETGWEPVLQEAKRAKIPVIIADRGIKVADDSLYTTLVGSDFVAEGRVAGKWLTKKMNGKANIIELQGTPGSAPAIDRRTGFAEEIAKTPGMKIIAAQSGDFRRAGGKEVMEALLKRYGSEVNAVYSHNDDMALGAIQAIEEAGKKPGVDIIVISVDGLKTAFDAIVAGKLNCTVECSPLLGPALFDAAEKVIKGEKLPKKITLPEHAFDSSNAAAALPDRKY